MSKLIQREAPPLSDRTQQILSLGQEALDGAEEVRKRTRRSVEAATECGKLLLEEQAHVTKELGKGTWESYFEIQFSKIIPRNTAWRWMRLSRTSSQLPTKRSTITPTMVQVEEPQLGADSITNELHAEAPEDPNLLRRGMLALDLFPAKTHTPTPEAGNDAPTPPPPAYSNIHLIALVSRFSSWHSAFMLHYAGAVTQEQCSTLLKDLKPISTFIDSLRA